MAVFCPLVLLSRLRTPPLSPRLYLASLSFLWSVGTVPGSVVTTTRRLLRALLPPDLPTYLHPLTVRLHLLTVSPWRPRFPPASRTRKTLKAFCNTVRTPALRPIPRRRVPIARPLVPLCLYTFLCQVLSVLIPAHLILVFLAYSGRRLDSKSCPQVKIYRLMFTRQVHVGSLARPHRPYFPHVLSLPSVAVRLLHLYARPLLRLRLRLSLGPLFRGLLWKSLTEQ